MGMYTEIVLGVEFKAEIPTEIIKELEIMCGLRERKVEPRLPRWYHMLRCGSYYFSGKPHVDFRFDAISNAWHLTVRSNFKNYDNELETFLLYIAPWLNEEGYIGYSRYEEAEAPTLIYITEGRLSCEEGRCQQ